MLGACGTSRFDVSRDPDTLSLMTELLVRSMQSAPGAVSLEQAHAEIVKKMQSRLAEINEKLRAEGKEPEPPYQPYMVNTCTKPVMLKP
jgi:hypothetical protein